MPSIAAAFVAEKVCRDVLLDFVGINFRICEISIDPGQAIFFTSVTCRLSDLQKPRSRRRSVSCDRVNVNKPKLQNFDRPLGLPGHLQSRFLRRQRVISSKYDSAGEWQLPSAAEQL